MGKREWFALGLVLAIAIVLHAVLPRYTVTVTTTGVFRFDRWSGHLDAAAPNALRQASWATVVRSRPAVGDDVTDLVNGPPAAASAPASPQPR